MKLKLTKREREIVRRFILDKGDSVQHLQAVYGIGPVNTALRWLLQDWNRRLTHIANDPMGSDASPLARHMMRTAENGLRSIYK